MAPTLQPNRSTPRADGVSADTLGAAEADESIVCREVDAGDAAAWTAFVASCPDANLGHLWAWRHVVENAYRKRCRYLAAVAGERWVGVLPLVHMRGLFADGRLVSLPFLDQAGVLATSPAAAACLSAAATRLAKSEKARGVELRALAKEGDPPSERVTLVLALPATADDLWKSFKPKVRNQVRKSEKSGLRTSRQDATRCGEFYRVFCENMRDLGSPVHARSFLESVFEAFGEAASLYLTEDASGRVVGGAVALRDGPTVTVPWASSLRRVFAWCPNHCLYWRVIQDAIAHGATRFDFGRSWIDAGTYRFKTQWGAVDRALAWTASDADGKSTALESVRPRDHGLAVRIWTRLPLVVANTVGPLVRRQLSN